MRCPFCDADKESLKVIDSRTCEGGRSIRRRRECIGCDKRFTTYERIEETVKLIVVKKDGRRMPWDRGKILSGLERACFKRPVPATDLLGIVDAIEEEIFKTHDREVPSTVVGTMVTDRLRRIDQVAYVRFASVYKQFKTLEELVDEAKLVLDARRFEDPDQGRLFVESTINGNGSAKDDEAHGPGKSRRRTARAKRSAEVSAPASDRAAGR